MVRAGRLARRRWLRRLARRAGGEVGEVEEEEGGGLGSPEGQPALCGGNGEEGGGAGPVQRGAVGSPGGAAGPTTACTSSWCP